MTQFNVTDEKRVKELFFNAFRSEDKYGWGRGKSSIDISHENLLVFMAFDGDDLYDIIFDKSKNEFFGDFWLLDKNKINALKSNLIQVIDQHKKTEQAQMKRESDWRREAGLKMLKMATSEKIKTLSVANVDDKTTEEKAINQSVERMTEEYNSSSSIDETRQSMNDLLKQQRRIQANAMKKNNY